MRTGKPSLRCRDFHERVDVTVRQTTYQTNVRIIDLLGIHRGWPIEKVHKHIELSGPLRYVQIPGKQEKQRNEYCYFPRCVPAPASNQKLLSYRILVNIHVVALLDGSPSTVNPRPLSRRLYTVGCML